MSIENQLKRDFTRLVARWPHMPRRRRRAGSTRRAVGWPSRHPVTVDGFPFFFVFRFFPGFFWKIIQRIVHRPVVPWLCKACLKLSRIFLHKCLFELKQNDVALARTPPWLCYQQVALRLDQNFLRHFGVSSWK